MDGFSSKGPDEEYGAWFFSIGALLFADHWLLTADHRSLSGPFTDTKHETRITVS
jgi:hypothetical protein